MEAVIEIGAIDDEKMLLQSFTNWFDGTPDIRLTVTAASVDEYLAKPTPPEIVLLDLDLDLGNSVRRAGGSRSYSSHSTSQTLARSPGPALS